MIKQELNENINTCCVRYFCLNFFCKSGHGIEQRTSTSESVYSEANDRKSPQVMDLGLLQAQAVTRAQLISPCHPAFDPKDFGFKGKELF